MAVFRRLPWFKAVTYILGQFIGAWLGALVVYANYSEAINIFEGGNGQRTLKTAGLFSTYPVCFVSLVLFFLSFDSHRKSFVLGSSPTCRRLTAFSTK
jgi:aquaglyceroporin related protein, other eukaryote